jgi:hypothetical protein
MLRTPYCLVSLLTDGGKVISFAGRRSTPQKHYCSASCTHFCCSLSKDKAMLHCVSNGSEAVIQPREQGTMAVMATRTCLHPTQANSSKYVRHLQRWDFMSD